MLEAARKVTRFTANRQLEAFVADEMAYDATLRNLEVLGEAAKSISRRDPPTPSRRGLARSRGSAGRPGTRLLRPRRSYPLEDRASRHPAGDRAPGADRAGAAMTSSGPSCSSSVVSRHGLQWDLCALSRSVMISRTTGTSSVGITISVWPGRD